MQVSPLAAYSITLTIENLPPIGRFSISNSYGKNHIRVLLDNIIFTLHYQCRVIHKFIFTACYISFCVSVIKEP